MTDFTENKPGARATPNWLMGGGEMGERARAFDWSQTPLGPLEQWPQSLRTAASICLSSKFPMVIWWGPELILFYNDGWRPILGEHKDMCALGSPGREVWAEIWDVIGPMFQQVMTIGQATWSDDGLLLVNRYGYTEEAYFTWSYSPIRDESGSVGGVFTAVTETTMRVIGERRMQALRDLAACGVQARDIETTCRLTAEALARYPYDFPFALLYRLSEDRRQAQLAGAAGIEPDTSASPRLVNWQNASLPATAWPLAEVAGVGQAAAVNNLAEQFNDLPAGVWCEPPREAIVMPLMLPGQDLPELLLVLAVSPRQQLNEECRNFFNLVAGQIAATLADAQAYEQERQRAEALAEIDRAKTEFFSNVSHEFRTPLTLLLGPLEDTLAEDGLPPAAHERLAVAHRNGVRLLKLVNTLLDFSRIEAGRVNAVYEPTDLAAFTAELASVFRSATEKAGLEFLVDCPPLDEPVYVDREMWEKIVLNLISNAFKFTFEGGIEVRLRQAGGAVELSVRDTGTGIPAVELPHLFERFHRIRNARGRSFEGSGIGLALVRELVKLHGGEVRVTSRLDAGSTFTVSIPTGNEHLPADRLKGEQGAEQLRTSTASVVDTYVEEMLRWLPESRNQPPDINSQFSESKRATLTTKDNGQGRRGTARILLADDNADMRDYVGRLLNERYEVEAVADGQAALEATRERIPDLILSDVMMPRLDGFGLLNELRAKEQTRTIPVILLSARAGEESRIEGLEAGADDYLVKPFSARELLARVDSALKLARVRREAQERITDIWESITDGFIVFDRDWRYTYLNPAAEALGLRRAELLGKTIWEAFPDVLGTELEEKFRRAASDRVSVEFEHYFAPWGRWFNNKIFPSADGNLTLYLRDVTDRKHVEEERVRLLDRERAARRQAEEASRLKDEFLATVSHELKTPLNSINGWAALLRAGRLGSEQSTRAIETIERSAKSQNQLINDLLDVSRIITGKMRLDIAPVRLAAVITAAAETVRPAADAKQIRLSVLLDPAAEMVSGDAERLQQVVWNLLSNAIKFAPKGGHVQVRLERVNTQVEITVADNGQGIKAEFLPHVFDRFRQEDGGASRQHGGLGLGLAIVRHLVELHGGTVRADSAGPGQGATFTVALPVIPVRMPLPNEDSRGARLKLPVESLPSLAGVRVLLVDDDRDGRELVMTVLTASGAEVRTADSAAEALAALDKWWPDILISDIGMPEEDGYVLLEKLRARERGEARLPAIALTAYARLEDRLRALSVGYQMHVPKPVEPAELLTVVASLIPSSRQRDGRR